MNKQIFLFILIFVFLINVVNAVYVGVGVNITTNEANITVVIDRSIDVNFYVVEDNFIYIDDITCSGNNKHINELNYTINNSIYLSSNFCYVESEPESPGGSPTQTTRIPRTIIIPGNESLIELNISDATIPINNTCPDGQTLVLIGNESRCFKCDGEIKITDGVVYCKKYSNNEPLINLHNLDFKFWVFVVGFIIVTYILLNIKKKKKKRN